MPLVDRQASAFSNRLKVAKELRSVELSSFLADFKLIALV
jgi:hypothetical protein